MPANIITELEDTLQDVGQLYKFRGLNVAVQNEYGTWSSTFGNSYNGVPLDTNMLIGIGSNTKTFISTCILQLVESGQLALTDTLGSLIPSYPQVNGSVTVKQILNHTSGLGDYTGNSAFWAMANSNLSKLWTKDEILQSYVPAPAFSPGASWAYCNTNYIVAGLILELKLAKPIHQIIRDSILTPLGMNETFFPPNETATQPYAHFWSDINGDNLLDDACNWNTAGAGIVPVEFNTCADAAGALVSTPSDITKFWKGLMTEKLISKNNLISNMMQWTNIGGGASYGLGIFKDTYFSNTVFEHGGTWIGQIHSNLADSTRGIYISVLSNQDSLDNDYTMAVVKALYKIMLSTAPTAVASQGLESNLTLYPNPTNDRIHIQSPTAIRKIQVYSFTGDKVYEQESGEPISVANLRRGSYVMQIFTDQDRVVRRFIKE